ncbi:LysM peptidoglycan-binding domain-containing protein [Paenibacillus sp. LMG 31460]|uniref:LysM peptidoglycan-binding domain-containing protein n=1 Tax=Paenibacillus germinis TaxID=2654979 RepID=A0ABX1Z4U0_9BACL|nr:GMC oxidoreductase [Paenibacillus germinis]NOU88393.1 LysM peptidoglycan-binding domain-containing protein [Paenibacillus germinis]
MKVYVADDGDTLRSIAEKYHVGIQDLLSCNQHITSPDQQIKGEVVKISSPSMKLRNPAAIPHCEPESQSDYLDQWIPLTSLEQMAQIEYDVIIVGTGAGGGAVLWRLCEQWGRNGKRIGVIEAGDLFLPTNVQNIPTMNAERYGKFWANPKFWKRIGMSWPDHLHENTLFPESSELAFKQFLALGGRTVLWNAVCPRMHTADIVKWPVSLQDMNLYYNIAEQVMNVSQSYTHGSSITQILLSQLRKGGFPEATDEPIAADLAETKYGEIHSNVFFSSILFLARALNKRPFDLAIKSRAVELLTEKGKVVGVKVVSSDKKNYLLKAKTIVLSTSTFETPRILLHSGISGTAIGHYLTNHSRVVGTGIVCRDDFPEILGTLGILIPRTVDRPYQIQIHGPGKNSEYYWYAYNEKPLRKEWEIDFIGSGMVESRYENKIVLDPLMRDEYGVPELKVQFSYSERDEDIIQKMGEGLKQASSTLKAPLVSEICRKLPGDEIHEMGTCRMGDNPSTSATNPYGQIHGVLGLYIADNSVIPTSGAANPTLTTIALAIRTADYIIQQFK